jgi:hypothetical protein
VHLKTLFPFLKVISAGALFLSNGWLVPIDQNLHQLMQNCKALFDGLKFCSEK